MRPGSSSRCRAPAAGMNSTRNHFEVYSYGALDTATVTIVGGAADCDLLQGGAHRVRLEHARGRRDQRGRRSSRPARRPCRSSCPPSGWTPTPPASPAPAWTSGRSATVVLGPLPVLLGNPTGASNLITGSPHGPDRALLPRCRRDRQRRPHRHRHGPALGQHDDRRPRRLGRLPGDADPGADHRNAAGGGRVRHHPARGTRRDPRQRRLQRDLRKPGTARDDPVLRRQRREPGHARTPPAHRR